MTDTAEEDVYLNIVFTWIAPRDRRGSKRCCLIGSCVSFRVIHGLMFLTCKHRDAYANTGMQCDKPDVTYAGFLV
jgi:hypothetical protein